MINKIKVKPDTVASKILFFDEIDLSQLPDRRIVPIYGANGSGKTTLIKNIEAEMFEISERMREDDEPEDSISAAIGRSQRKIKAGIDWKSDVDLDCDHDRTKYYSYRNGRDNFAVAEPRSYMESFDPLYLNLRFNAQSLSEGQSIVYSAETLLKGMLKSTKKKESFVDDDTHAIVLLDEIDSGMSLDNLERMCRIIQKVLKQGRNIQFFMSFNNPYVLNFFPYVISMYDGKVHELNNINEMLEDLKANQKILDKARKKRNGEYKIF